MSDSDNQFIYNNFNHINSNCISDCDSQQNKITIDILN